MLAGVGFGESWPALTVEIIATRTSNEPLTRERDSTSFQLDYRGIVKADTMIINKAVNILTALFIAYWQK